MSLMILSLISIEEGDDLEGFNMVMALFFGLIFGSFLSMLIYRLPLGISLVNPKRSACPKCKKDIRWYENIPVFSYIFLKGECGNCGQKISLIYPIIELTTGIITLCLFLAVGLSEELILLGIIFYLFIMLSFIDFQHKAVPDYLLILLVLFTLGYLSVYNMENIAMMFSFAGGIVLLELLVTFYIQNIKAKILKDESLREQKSLGEGDVPIFAVIGGILGLKLGLIAIFVAALLAIIPSILNRVIKKDIEIPFIPFLALGFCMVYFNQETILKFFNSLYGA